MAPATDDFVRVTSHETKYRHVTSQGRKLRMLALRLRAWRPVMTQGLYIIPSEA